MQGLNDKYAHVRRLALSALIAVSLAGCASVSFDRQTETSGKFKSTGWSLTLLSIDLPKHALQIARDNASDAGLPNMQVQSIRVWPSLGSLDWILDIFVVRRAVVRGTWGYEE